MARRSQQPDRASRYSGTIGDHCVAFPNIFALQPNIFPRIDPLVAEDGCAIAGS